jgi:uncharacterized protein (DUF2147 family)
MRTKLFAAALAVLPFAVLAQQNSPIGRWKTIDDETGKVKSIVEIQQAANGTLQGKVVDVLQSDRGPNPKCDKCSGANKGKPVKGMTILWGLREDGGAWSGGTILDPSKGKTYKSKAKMLAPDKLGVSGCLAFICREQTWIRE